MTRGSRYSGDMEKTAKSKAQEEAEKIAFKERLLVPLLTEMLTGSGLSHAALAERMGGYARQYVYNVLRLDNSKMPSIEKLFDWAEACGYTLRAVEKNRAFIAPVFPSAEERRALLALQQLDSDDRAAFISFMRMWKDLPEAARRSFLTGVHAWEQDPSVAKPMSELEDQDVRKA